MGVKFWSLTVKKKLKETNFAIGKDTTDVKRYRCTEKSESKRKNSTSQKRYGKIKKEVTFFSCRTELESVNHSFGSTSQL